MSATNRTVIVGGLPNGGSRHLEVAMRNHLCDVVPLGQLPAVRVTAVAGGQAELLPAGEAWSFTTMPLPGQRTLPVAGPAVDDREVQFDHLVHLVPTLDAAVRDYQALGFTVQPGGHHPGSGTHNAAWRLDTRYIELIAVCDEPAARASAGPGWPEIEEMVRAGGGALAFAVLVDDVAATAADLRSRGIQVGDPQAGSIRRTDGSTGAWHTASLQDGPRWAPFFINYGFPIDQWTARFREQGFPKDPWGLHGVTVQVPDPAASASWLGEIFAVDAVRIGPDAAEVRLPGCPVMFTRGLTGRITAVILIGPGAPQGSVAGLRYLNTAQRGQPPDYDAV